MTLEDLCLYSGDVTVLGVQRGSGTYVGAPHKRTCIEPGDRLIVYGRCHQLSNIDFRCSGEEGNRQHADACRLQEQIASGVR